MKIKSLFATALAGLFATAAAAAPLERNTAVHARPDSTSPAITELPAGTEPIPATGFGIVPSGWLAIELKGPHTVFVLRSELNKSLEVAAGTSLRTAASESSPVLAVATADEPLEIMGLRGRWTELALDKSITGYLRIGPASAPVTMASTPAPASSTPADVTAPASNTAGRPAPMVNQGDGGSSSLPRLFQGRLTSTRHPLRPRRPYDYQVLDERGERYAYVDLSRLLVTEQVDNYLDRIVVIHGPARALPGTNDIVITAESLQVR